jgi:hypothetical protein
MVEMINAMRKWRARPRIAVFEPASTARGPRSPLATPWKTRCGLTLRITAACRLTAVASRMPEARVAARIAGTVSVIWVLELSV